jgi:3-hydroxyacyl-[acyl-carrier-protein] dehydratase
MVSLDRVLELETGRGARALSNITNTMDVFDSHFPRFPVLPGVLVLSAIARLASLLLDSGGRRGWELAAADNIRFRHYVLPGDQLELAVRVVEVKPESAQLTAEAQVDGRRVATVGRLLMRTVKQA